MNTPPNSSGPVVITEVPNYFLVRIPSDQGERARRIPGRQWDGNRKMWVFPKDLPTYEALDDDVICKLRRNLSPADRAALPADAASAPGWIADIFHRVAKDPTAASSETSTK